MAAILRTVNQPNNKALLKTLIIVILVITILFSIADIIWQTVPSPSAPKQPVQITQQQSAALPASSTNNVTDLLALHIFGEASQTPVQVETVTNAPETKLNLTLTGVVASTDEKSGAAIIANRNTQNTYGIGEKIEGTQATLHRVLADRVIISNRGAKETLMLDGIDFSKVSSATSTQAAKTNPASSAQPVMFPANQRIPKNVVKQLPVGPSLESIAELRAAPEKFTDFINISPIRQEGELQGYRVTPGKNPALFIDSELKTGDVITNINGLDLTQPREAVQAMQALRQSQSLEIAIMRNNQPMTLSLSLP